MVIYRKSGINIILFLFLILGMTSRVVSDELPLEERLASEGFSLPTEDRPEAPDFSLKLLGGDEVKLSDYRGKVVFMNFWATWCGPCRFEMPSMQRLYDSVASDQFEIIAVNLREDEDMVFSFAPTLSEQTKGINLAFLWAHNLSFPARYRSVADAAFSSGEPPYSPPTG